MEKKELGVDYQDATLRSIDPSPQSKDWPHAPVHRLGDAGAYMVTSGTYKKISHLHSSERLEIALQMLFQYSAEFGWSLQAWAVMSNHYHFVALSPDDPSNLPRMIGKLHMKLAKEINSTDGTPGRKVWYQYWDSYITFERSFLARLNYVHNNPVHHGLVAEASSYRWCSAAWFEREANPAFVKSVKEFKTERLNIPDDF